MDAHFVRPKDASKSKSNLNLLATFKRFLPVMALAVILPFLLGFIIAPPELGFRTSADSPAEVRVWAEPHNVIASKGNSIELTFWASMGDNTKLIPEIEIGLVSTSNLSVKDRIISRKVPFSGKTIIGKTTIDALSTGDGQVQIPPELVKITAFQGVLDIKTSPANIVVR